MQQNLGHLQPARLEADDRLRADGRRQDHHMPGLRPDRRPVRHPGRGEGGPVDLAPELRDDRSRCPLGDQCGLRRPDRRLRPGRRRHHDRVEPAGRHARRQRVDHLDLGPGRRQPAADEWGERVVAHQQHPGAVDRDPGVEQELDRHHPEV